MNDKTLPTNLPLALFLCDSGGEAACQIGQGHVFRCRAFAAHLESLGWQTVLLELHACNTALQSTTFSWKKRPQRLLHHITFYTEYCTTMRLKVLQSLSSLSIPELCTTPQLMVLDSYQFPKVLYDYIASTFLHSRLVAIDDFANQTRLQYPQKFFVLQALRLPETLPKQATRYLCGLPYQVLRKEFTNGRNAISNSMQPGRFCLLLVPGSGLSIEELQELVFVIVDNLQILFQNAQIPNINRQNKELIVLLSARQADKLVSLPLKEQYKNVSIHYLGGLLELRPIYERADLTFCAAGQSLLEHLAVSSNTRICALLCADNQEALLGCLHKSGLDLPFVDLRPALLTNVPNCKNELANALKNALFTMRFPVLSLPINSGLSQLGDGKAVQRILLRLGL